MAPGNLNLTREELEKKLNTYSQDIEMAKYMLKQNMDMVSILRTIEFAYRKFHDVIPMERWGVGKPEVKDDGKPT